MKTNLTEMAYAYKTITNQMGPSPQLIAFVNHDKIDTDNCGLESFDFMSQHEQILNEIDNLELPALELDSDGQEVLEAGDLFQLGDELDQLEKIHSVIDQFGLNASTVGVLQATNLLAGTSLQTIALESLDAHDAHIAQESVLDSIKEKAAAWGAKIMALLKKISSYTIEPVVTKIKTTCSKLVDKISHNKLGKTIKAHPYATALAVLAGIVAAANIITFIGTRIELAHTANNGGIEKAYDDVVKMIEKQSGMRDISPRPAGPDMTKFINYKYDNLKRFHKIDIEPPKVGTWEELGWTKQNLVDLSAKIGPTVTKVNTAVALFAKASARYMAHSAMYGMEALQIPGVSKKASHTIITSLFWATYRLVKTKIGGGYHLIAAMLLRLAGH